MNIKKKQADELLYYGFYDNVAAPQTPGTAYWFGGKEWVVGGTADEKLIPNSVLKGGTWLPNEKDLLSFLDRSGCSVNYSYNGLWFNMKIYPHGGSDFSLRTASLIDGLFEAALRILNSDF